MRAMDPSTAAVVIVAMFAGSALLWGIVAIVCLAIRGRQRSDGRRKAATVVARIALVLTAVMLLLAGGTWLLLQGGR